MPIGSKTEVGRKFNQLNAVSMVFHTVKFRYRFKAGNTWIGPVVVMTEREARDRNTPLVEKWMAKDMQGPLPQWVKVESLKKAKRRSRT